MGIQFDAVGNLWVQVRARALLIVEVLAGLIARIDTFDHSISVLSVSSFKERP